MAQTPVVTVQYIHEQIGTIPPESLADLAEYIDFLRFKVDRDVPEPEPASPLRIVPLRGLLKGYDFAPELLTQTRSEMWKKLQSTPQPSAM